MARIEGGAQGLAFSSGMAAIDCILRLFRPGDTIVVSEDPYGGTFRLLEKVYREMGVEVVFVDTSDIRQVEQTLDRRPKAILVESPTNPLLKVADLKAIAQAARENDVLFVVDNTFLTCWFQRPLALGADAVIYSATKYLSGHNDVLAGLLVTKSEELGERLYFYQNSVGAVPGPWDCWLVLRGPQDPTLKAGPAAATECPSHSGVANQPTPGRPGALSRSGMHPGHGLLKSQASGFGSIISFEVKDPGIVPPYIGGGQGLPFCRESRRGGVAHHVPRGPDSCGHGSRGAIEAWDTMTLCFDSRWA